MKRAGGRVFIRAARRRATPPNSTPMLGNPGLIGGQLFVTRGGSFLASAEDIEGCFTQEILFGIDCILLVLKFQR